MKPEKNSSMNHKPKLLLLTAPLAPLIGNNANLLGKLVPFISQQYDVRLFSMADGYDHSKLPDMLFGVPVMWGDSNGMNRFMKFVYSVLARLVDHNGYSDAIQVLKCTHEIKRIRKTYPFDIAIATIEPYYIGIAPLRLRDVRNVLYLMDPTNAVQGVYETRFRNKIIGPVIRKEDLIITTPFIKQALQGRGFDTDCVKIAGFPMIDRSPLKSSLKTENEKIDLLFCGWLYSDIRSPEFFLKTVSYMDERFRITFMGRDCEKIYDMVKEKIRAEIIAVPQQTYEVALQTIADADILINIGNSVPVHMPSKTLEYINAGKPIINFYKRPDCPTLYYTERYPLCLNVYEGMSDIREAAKTVIEFCLCNKGRTVDRNDILSEYRDCTPRYIAEKIIEGIDQFYESERSV